MNHHRRVLVPAVALVSFALVSSGCSFAPEPTPTSAPAFASEQEAFAAAEETYRAYIDAFNAIDLRDPSTFEPLDQYTTGAYRAGERKQLSELHAEGFIRTGAIVVDSVVGSELVGDQVRARVCEDVGSVDLRDSAGKSLVTADRPEHVASEVTLDLVDRRLRIAEVRPIEDVQCAG